MTRECLIPTEFLCGTCIGEERYFQSAHSFWRAFNVVGIFDSVSIFLYCRNDLHLLDVQFDGLVSLFSQLSFTFSVNTTIFSFILRSFSCCSSCFFSSHSLMAAMRAESLHEWRPWRVKKPDVIFFASLKTFDAVAHLQRTLLVVWIHPSVQHEWSIYQWHWQLARLLYWYSLSIYLCQHNLGGGGWLSRKMSVLQVKQAWIFKYFLCWRIPTSLCNSLEIAFNIGKWFLPYNI